MWKIAKKTGNLDMNSPYAYIMVGEYFADTSILAEEGAEAAGFISGFQVPARPDTLFVWQVGVDPDRHGKGIGTRMLGALLHRRALEGVCYLETTVTPSNDKSMALFEGIARRLSTECARDREFGRELFPHPDHEEEVVLRIGPFTPQAVQEGLNP